MKFRAFRRKKDNLYYFQFLSETNQVRLNSPSYTDKDLCFNGIRDVINSASKRKNYEKRTDKEGNHFFILKTAKGQEIGRSVRYKTEKEIDPAIAEFMAEAPLAATKETESSSATTKSEATKTSTSDKKGRVYLRQNQAYLCNNITFDTFQSEGNQRYYFVFKDKEDNAILINSDVRGFASLEELENGVKAVMEFAPINKNYEKKVAKNGKHYFLIKSTKGKSIAKSGVFYSLKSDMNAAIKLVQCVGVEMSAPAIKPLTDNYLPIAAYAGAEGFHTFSDEGSGQHYFAFNNAEGKTFLRSEGYKTAQSRDNGIQSVIKNGPLEKNWNTASENNLHYYTLKAGNNQEIARSAYYKEETEMLEDYELVKGESSPIGVGSALVGGALMSALMIKKRKEEEKREKEEAKRKKEEEKRKAEETSLAALAAANLAAEREAKQKAIADQLKAEQEAKLAAEAEAAAKLAAEEERKKKAAAEAAAALALANTQKTPMTTMSSTANSSSGGSSLAWLIPLIIGILLIIAALIYFKGCEGCGKPVPPIKNPVTPIDTVEQDTTPYGKGGSELGFIPGSMEFLMADHLKAYDSTFPKTFTAENISFAKNQIRLDTKARKQLDNLAVLLKEYPNARITIYGYITAGEKTFYKGNKELSLDDARAREVFNYLKQNGIKEDRMEFYGNGMDDKAGIKINLLSRGVTR